MRVSILLVLLSCLFLPAGVSGQEASSPVVRALLFFSPTCQHCQQVISSTLLPMVETYQEQLQILVVDVSSPPGNELYQEAVDHFRILDNRLGVPTLIVGDTVLVGGGEIPDQFPGIVEEGLAAEGIAWPDMPALLAQLAAETTPATATPAAEAVDPGAAPPQPAQPQVEPAQPGPGEPAEAEPAPPAAASVADRQLEVSESITRQDDLAEAAVPPVEEDPLGLALAWLVLVGMTAALVYSAWRLATRLGARPAVGLVPIRRIRTLFVPALALLGLGVAGYLAYVELTQVEAVCGPVGHCNLVQSSPYAQILGVPVAVLGLLAYGALIVLWLMQRSTSERSGALAASGLLALTVFATAFSVYLTLLELLVIRAVCAWCLSSALISTVLMLIAVGALIGPGPIRSLSAHGEAPQT